ncbi:MAG: hypothetical protein HQL20_05615 [Candidatus Omnitrophica bacterium]|nr:hypothetical protein [Candidatus Omnitrophota bacterium]
MAGQILEDIIRYAPKTALVNKDIIPFLGKATYSSLVQAITRSGNIAEHFDSLSSLFRFRMEFFPKEKYSAFRAALANEKIAIDVRMQIADTYTELLELSAQQTISTKHSLTIPRLDGLMAEHEKANTAIENVLAHPTTGEILTTDDIPRLRSILFAFRKAFLESALDNALPEHMIPLLQNTSSKRFHESIQEILRLASAIRLILQRIHNHEKNTSFRTITASILNKQQHTRFEDFLSYFKLRVKLIESLSWASISIDDSSAPFFIELFVSGNPLYTHQIKAFLVLDSALNRNKTFMNAVVKFLSNKDIKLNLRMSIIPGCTELLKIEQNIRSKTTTPRYDPPLKRRMEWTLRAFTRYLAYVKNPQLVKKIPARMTSRMTELRQYVLEDLLEKKLPAKLTPLLNDDRFINTINTMVSVLNNMVRNGQNEQTITALTRFAINRFIAVYTPPTAKALQKANGNTRRTLEAAALKNAEKKVTDTLMNIDDDFWTKEGLENPGKRYTSNSTISQHLKDAQYDPMFLSTGFTLPWTLNAGTSNLERKEQIRKTVIAMLETVLELGVTSLNGERLSLTSAPDQITTTAKAEDLLKAVKASGISIPRAQEQFLQNMLTDIRRIEAEMKNTDETSPATVEVAKNVFRESTIGGYGGQGCFAIGGVAQIRPAITGFSPNITFIRVHNQSDELIATADVVLGKEGAFIEAIYSGSSYNVTPAFAAAIAKMAEFVPQVVLGPKSAAYDFFAQYIPPSQTSVTITRESGMFPDAYFDTTPRNNLNEQVFTIRDPIIITKALLQKNKALTNLLASETKQEKPKLDPKVTGPIFRTITDTVTEYYKDDPKMDPKQLGRIKNAYYKSLEYLNKLLTSVRAQGTNTLPSKTYIDYKENLALSGFPFVPELADNIMDAAFDFFENHYNVEIVTIDAAAAQGRTQNPGGINMNPDLLDITDSGTTQPIMPADHAALPEQLSGLIPIVTSIIQLSTAAQFIE